VRGAPYTVSHRTTGAACGLDGVAELADLMTLDLANRLEQLPQAPMSLRRMEADRRLYERAVPLLPRAAVAALHRTYRPRPFVLVLVDGLFRRTSRLLRRLRARRHAG